MFIFEGKVVNSLIEFFKTLANSKQYSNHFKFINDIFVDELENSHFLFWLHKRIGVKYYFSTQFDIWKRSGKQGRNKISTDLCKKVSNLQIENFIPSVDRQNGREFVNCRKIEYIKKYHNIKNSPPLDETSK